MLTALGRDHAERSGVLGDPRTERLSGLLLANRRLRVSDQHLGGVALLVDRRAACRDRDSGGDDEGNRGRSA